MAEQRQTPETPRMDPFELWKEIYDTNEQAWTKAIKDLTSTPTYAEAQGKMLEVFLNFQKTMRDATTAQLAAYNLPTRDDVSSLGEVVIGVEEKIDRLDETIAKLEGMVSEQTQRLARVELALRAVESKTSAIEEGQSARGAESKAGAREEIGSAAQPRSRRAAQS